MIKKRHLIGSVMATTSMAIVLVIFAIGTYQLAILAGDFLADPSVLPVVILENLLFLTTLVLNAVIISGWNNIERYKKLKGTIISAGAFNTISIIVLSAALFEMKDTLTIVLYVLMILSLVASNLCIGMDFEQQFSNKKETVESNVDENNNVQTLENNIKEEKPLNKTVENKVQVKEKSSDDDFVNQLLKLEKVREKKLVSEEEYQLLRKKIIDREMKKED